MRVIGDITRLNARRYPDKPALVMGDAVCTYSELDRRSNRLANALIAAGVRPGDRVALLAYNSIDFAVVTQGVAKCGAILTPLNFRLAAGEIAHVIGDAEPLIFITETVFGKVLGDALAQCGQRPQIVMIDGESGTQGAMCDLMAGALEAAPQVEIDPASPCVIMYTSGTTGAPKGVLVSHATYFKMYAVHAIEARIRHDDVFLLAVPMFHAAGMNMALHQALFLGATGIVHRGPFDPEVIFELIQKHRVTLAILVPTTVSILAHHPRVGEYDLSSLDKIFYGSMPILPKVLAKAREVFPQVNFTQFYGSTECGAVGVLRSEDHERWSQTTGREVLLTESRIVDGEGRAVPVGGVGQVIVRQASMGMIGYWRNDKATAETIRDGWIYSGDLARRDSETHFTIVDRLKDVIISGGENIYPKEVENALSAHPAVREVAVFGIPDELYGEAVCAAVAFFPGMSAGIDELEAFCRERLAGYKRPRKIDVHDNLPKNSSDKIQKTLLRAAYRKGQV
jgi:fatty-acyl-CoA synthase